jgi:tetraacyldisaccharide 4'-kinase
MKRPWLAPFTLLYAAGLALRNRRIDNGSELVRHLRYPVVSVGNLSTGGSGKTPLTIALANALAGRGLRVDVLSRGYGRQSRLAVRVNPNGAAEEFGDEPLLIARETGLPVYVAPQRYDAGLLAEAEQSLADKGSGLIGQGFSPDTMLARSAGALAPEVRIHLLDDGFQHRQLARDANILLLNRHDWFDCLLPAGNLREPTRAAHRATILAIPADDPAFAVALKAWGWHGQIWRLHRKMAVPSVAGPIVAFCGIARPGQFFAGLEAAGLQLAARFVFPDHHRYAAADLNRLAASAHKTGAAGLMTTKKDQVRLGQLTSALPAWLPLTTARLRIEIEDDDRAIDSLLAQLPVASSSPPL